MTSPTRRALTLRLLCAALVALALAACSRQPDVVIYCALDQVHAEPILREFERRTGLVVRAEFDVEASKTVGLVRRIQEEARRRTRCDVFWNNEIAHTIKLADEGLLAVYDSPQAADIPETFRDPERRWTGLAARARCFIVNTELVQPEDYPRSMWDLVDGRWKGKVGMARPLTGTTLTHMTALFSVLGESEARRYLDRILETGVRLTSGNATLMRQVREGALAWGWTDTDDYYVAKEGGYPVDVVFPDADGIGTLVIPNTVAILADAPHPEAARRLVDYILSPEVERRLAESRSAQIPLHASLQGIEHPLPLDRLKPMEVDFQRVGREIDERTNLLRELFLD